MLRIVKIGLAFFVFFAVAIVVLNVVCFLKMSTGCTTWRNCTFIDVDSGYCYTATAVPAISGKEPISCPCYSSKEKLHNGTCYSWYSRPGVCPLSNKCENGKVFGSMIFGNILLGMFALISLGLVITPQFMLQKYETIH